MTTPNTTNCKYCSEQFSDLVGSDDYSPLAQNGYCSYKCLEANKAASDTVGTEFESETPNQMHKRVMSQLHNLSKNE